MIVNGALNYLQAQCIYNKLYKYVNCYEVISFCIYLNASNQLRTKDQSVKRVNTNDKTKMSTYFHRTLHNFTMCIIWKRFFHSYIRSIRYPRPVWGKN